MSLTTVPRYDSEQLSERPGHAVVIGAGIAGLVVARVLSDAFTDVTVIDRDPLPDEPVTRRGVPQASQIHILWEGGRKTLEELFPGYSEELLAAGGVAIDGQREFYTYNQGNFLASGTEPFPLYAATRPLYEHLLRQRVAELEGVQLRGRCPFVDYVTDDAVTAVEGVRVRDRNGGEDELPADVVVDATGRTSRTPHWLDEHGYTPPPVEEVHIDLAYSATLIERPPDDHRMIGVLSEPPRTRGGAVLPVEDDRWLVNVHGMHGDHPPTDLEGTRAFAASLPVPVISDLLEEYPVVSAESSSYPFPSSRRYRYEDIEEFPDGLLVIGDAIASFNPVYGQGMTVAALEALTLHHALGLDERRHLALEFFDRSTAIVDTAWALAAGADAGYSQTRGDTPRGATVLNWYLNRLLGSAHTDGVLTDAFTRVISMQRPPSSLFHPRILWRVFRPGKREQDVGRQESGLETV